jgi:outer membrane lipoprotein-sorting protein
MRVRALGPKVLDPITSVLKHLFHPILLLPLLLLTAFAHWWLYKIHGLSSSLEAVLASPSGLPIVVAVILVAAWFHEFGHAAALTYGGGKVRGMGMGLYLIYPALYTDVTDAYRLGRGARVRTDLGGIYFHALACLALIGIAIHWKAELLLSAVALINIEMIRQFVPLVRLDGYWLLADLTGIPDFFSQMGPFIRSMIGSKRIQGKALPTLKPWVRAVFATYIVVVIPALAYFLFVMLRMLPGFLFNSGSVLNRQAQSLLTLMRDGNVSMSLLLTLTMLLLLASLFGILYMLVITIMPPVLSAWKWSRGVPARVIPVGVASTVLAGSLGILWYPEVIRLAERSKWSVAERQGRDLLERAAAAAENTESLRATITGALGDEPFKGAVLLKRPNLARVTIHGEGGLGTFEVISDGSRLHRFFPVDNKIVTSPPGENGRNIRGYVADQVEFFFNPGVIKRRVQLGTVEFGGKLKEDGITYAVVNHVSPSPARIVTRYFISDADGLIHGVTVLHDGGRTGNWAKLTNVQRDVPVEDATFAWTPPADASPASLPVGVGLPIGTAPSFSTR